MDVILERCAGIDVAKDEVVACVRTPGPGGRGRRKQTRTFLSFTAELEAMADWSARTLQISAGERLVLEAALARAGGTAFELKLVNARHVKILPGRKSDVLDDSLHSGNARPQIRECPSYADFGVTGTMSRAGLCVSPNHSWRCMAWSQHCAE